MHPLFCHCFIIIIGYNRALFLPTAWTTELYKSGVKTKERQGVIRRMCGVWERRRVRKCRATTRQTTVSSFVRAKKRRWAKWKCVPSCWESHCCQLLMYRERVGLFYRISWKEICRELINLSVVMPHLEVLVCGKKKDLFIKSIHFCVLFSKYFQSCVLSGLSVPSGNQFSVSEEDIHKHGARTHTLCTICNLVFFCWHPYLEKIKKCLSLPPCVL